jgi:hypothetical protein
VELIVQVAILSLCKRQKDSALLGVGLLPVGNATLLKYHIMLAQRAGASKILCHIDAVPGELAQHEDFARERGMAWVNIRNIAEIGAHIGDEDDALIIADGYYSEPALFEAFITSDETGILTADSDGAFPGFERLDINTLWAGLLKLPGTAFATLADVPDDWSLESVLLRQAIADKTPMQMVTGKDIDYFGLCDASAVPIDLRRSISAANSAKIKWRPFERLTRFSASKLAPILWQNTKHMLAADILIGILCITAIILAYFGIYIAAIIAVFIGFFLVDILQICARPLPADNVQKYRVYAVIASAFMAAAISAMGFLQLITAQLFTVSILSAIGLFAALQWALLQILAARQTFAKPWLQLTFDPLVQTIWLIAGAFFIIFPQMLFLLTAMQLAIITLSYKVADNVALTKS